MKNSKRIISAVIAVLLAFAMAIPGFSEEAAVKTNITMDGDTGNANYYGYKLMDVSVVEEGEGAEKTITKAAYTINDKYRDILKKATVTATQGSISYDDAKGEPTDDQIIEYLQSIAGNSNEEEKAAAIRNYADNVYALIISSKDPVIAPDAQSGTGKFEGIDQGYWLIIGKSKYTAEDGTEGNTLVMLDTAGKTEVKVTVKPIDVPDVTKELKDEDSLMDNNDWKGGQVTDKLFPAAYQVGDYIPFRLSARPQHPDISDKSYDDFTSYYLKFTDTLSEGLKYNSGAEDPYGKIVVYAVGPEKTYTLLDKTSETTEANKKQGYVVNYNEASRTLTVELQDLKSLVDSANPEGGAIEITPEFEIVVEYYAQLLPSAASTNHETNNVQIEYSDDPFSDHKHTSEPTQVDVYTYGLVIDKVEQIEDEMQFLEGAEFKLYKVDTKTNEETEIVAGDGNGVQIKYYVVDPATGQPSTLLDNNTDKKAVRFTFEGLDEGTYILRETTVPDGYNKIDDIEFVIEPLLGSDLGVVGVQGNIVGEGNGITFTAGNEELGQNKFFLYTTIENKTGLELPSTGGTGRTVLVLFGCLCALIAGVILVTNKRMKSES